MGVKPKAKLLGNQEGVASIIVAVMLMLIMSLIVLTMSQNTQREQRQTLDRQLSDQAFYNAESGINDAAAYLYKNPLADLEKNDCASPLGTISNTLDDRNNKYTCLLYDKAPKTIQYDKISYNAPRIIPIQPVNEAGAPTDIGSLTIGWDDSADRDGNITGACSFSSGSPALPETCDYGGLRFELISPSANRDLLRQRSFIAFLLPNNAAGGNISISGTTYPNNQGIISATNCSGPAGQRRCSKTITDINRANMYLSVRSLYRPVNITISGLNTSGNQVRFKDTQIMIDSTGKANDVLRRVQVRIPATSQYDYPGFSLQSKDSVCKIMNVTRADDGSGSAYSTDPSACPVD